jgi:putative ABC transport system permease protein
VKDVASGQDSLLVGGFWGTAQLAMKDGTYRPVAGNFVSVDYQRAAGIVLKRGRWFSGQRGAVEAVINESMARQRFGDEDPIGQSFQIQVSKDLAYRVVGVAADVKDTARSSDGMRYYVPDWMYPPNISTLILRLEREPEKEFADVVRRAIFEIEPHLITNDVSSVATIVGRMFYAEGSAFATMRALSPIALGLAAVGLFSVIGYTVEIRMKEFGVRLALGAKPSSLQRLVMIRGLATVAAGVVVGTAAALGMTQFMRNLLFETDPYDPLVYAVVALVLLGTAIAAFWLPARRAGRVDITSLLRAE